MKYVLILSFYYKKYKNHTGELQIHLNDRLIDSITLDHDIKQKDVDLSTRSKDGNTTWKYQYIRPEKLFYYEVDDSILRDDRENKLTISVKNDNNNYTNGFMTKTSWLSIEDIYFLPLALFDPGKINKICERLKEKFWNSKGKELDKTTEDSMLKLYKNEANKIDNKFLKSWLWGAYHRENYCPWPGITHPLTYTHTSENYEGQTRPPCPTPWSVGGSFVVSLPISKKHKIYSIRQKNFKGPYFSHISNFYQIMVEFLKDSPHEVVINTSTKDSNSGMIV